MTLSGDDTAPVGKTSRVLVITNCVYQYSQLTNGFLLYTLQDNLRFT